MAIQALGAKPHMMLHPALQSRENHKSSEAEAGDVNVTPRSEQISDGESGGKGKHGELYGRSHVQQTLHHLDQSVRQRIMEALKESEFDPQEQHDISRLTHEFKVDLNRVYHDASEGPEINASTLADGVRDAITTLTDGLRMTLSSMLPPVPWEPEIPPEPDPEKSTFDVQVQSEGIDRLA